VSSPMVGRDSQLRQLEQLFQIVKAGQGRVACILGEPGMGKSRLLAELRTSLEGQDDPPRWVEGRCLSYGETMTYHPLPALVRAAAASGPVAMVCDDLHWADPASTDSLLTLLQTVAGLPILFILSSRQERTAAGWRLIAGAREIHGDALTELRLDPLSIDDSRTLVSNLLTIESLPDETRDLILARAEGNPFFVEEVIRMLIDRGAIVREGDPWVATDKVAGIEI